MKRLLFSSLILNLVLAYFLVFQKKETTVVERLIIETHPDKKTKAKEEEVKAPEVEKKKKPRSERETEMPPVMNDPEEFQHAGERMEEKRKDFFTEKLGMSEEKISEHNRLRDEFYQQSALFWQKNPMRELSFKERREMIDLEEAFYKKLENLHGKENWKRYQKFRESYNEKGHKRQIEEGEPFIFMGI
jgi:hypothetical protein